MSASKIIYLNGPSSCGKTTLAKALQEAFEEPFLHLSIDKMIGLMPAKINDWEGGEAPLGFSWEADTDLEGKRIFHVRAGPFAKRIVRTFKEIALLLVAQHYNLILDDVAFGVVEVAEWKEVLKDFDVLYVGVIASLDILEEREHSRKDRCVGSARAQYEKVHKDVTYDLEIDTTANSLKESVAKIRAALRS